MPEKSPSGRPSVSFSAVGGPAKRAALRQPGEPNYAELLAASNFSFLRGASHPEELAAAAALLDLAGFAIADVNTLAGAVRGHLAARQTGARYAVGCRLSFRDGTPDIAAWPTDRTAYGHLCRLLTTGNLRAKKGECHLHLADLLEWGAGMELAVLPGDRFYSDERGTLPLPPGERVADAKRRPGEG
ncbi:MAG TPA: PHP domain-containing protein, partial [Propylenella sp.]